MVRRKLDAVCLSADWFADEIIYVEKRATIFSPILIDTVTGLSWSFGVTFVILWVMNKIPGLSLRVDIEVERGGLDQGELGFSCYEHVEDVRSIKESTEKLSEHAIVSNGHSNFAFQIEQSRM